MGGGGNRANMVCFVWTSAQSSSAKPHVPGIVADEEAFVFVYFFTYVNAISTSKNRVIV